MAVLDRFTVPSNSAVQIYTCIDVDVMSAPLHAANDSTLHEEIEMTSLCK